MVIKLLKQGDKFYFISTRGVNLSLFSSLMERVELRQVSQGFEVLFFFFKDMDNMALMKNEIKWRKHRKQMYLKLTGMRGEASLKFSEIHPRLPVDFF